MGHDFSNLNAITQETVLDFIEEAKKYAKEEAIRDYYVNLLMGSKEFIMLRIGRAMTKVLRRLGIRLQRVKGSDSYYQFNDDEKSMGIDFLLYMLKEKPRLDLEIFDEHDRKEIIKFVVYCALLSAAEKSQLFDEEDLSFWREYDVLVKNVKRLKNHLVLTWKGKEYKLPLNYVIDIAVFFHRYGIDELPSIITAQVEGKDIIDGGAFVGDSMLILSELKPRRIYAFEPSSQNFPLLKKTVRLNALSNVVLVKKSLGAKRGRTRMYPYGVGSFVSEIYGRPKGEEVEVVSIDEFAKENALEVGLIKLDVEGSEYDVIAGARETIKTFRPILIVCIYHRGKDFFEIPRLVKELVPEYKLRFLCVNRRHPTFDRVLLSYIDEPHSRSR